MLHRLLLLRTKIIGTSGTVLENGHKMPFLYLEHFLFMVFAKQERQQYYNVAFSKCQCHKYLWRKRSLKLVYQSLQEEMGGTLTLKGRVGLVLVEKRYLIISANKYLVYQYLAWG